MFSGELIEDSNHVLACDGRKDCRFWIHIRGLDPPQNVLPVGDWVCSRCRGEENANSYEYTFEERVFDYFANIFSVQLMGSY